MRTEAFEPKEYKGKKVAVFETATGQSHLLASFDICRRLSEAGCAVEFNYIEGVATLPSIRSPWLRFMVDSIPLSKKLRWRLSPHLNLLNSFKESLKEQGFNSISFRLVEPRELNFGHSRVPPLPDQASLKKFRVAGLPAGHYILSSLISLTSDNDIRPSENRRRISKLASKFSVLADFAQRYLSSDDFDAILLFNGRFVENGPFIEVARSNSITVLFHETGGLVVKAYAVTPYRPHDVKNLGNTALSTWKQLRRGFHTQAVERINHELESMQSAGGLADRRIQSKSRRAIKFRHDNVVVFFTSTEGEFSSINDLSPESNYSSQMEALCAVYEVCKEIGYHLIVRVHPNVRNSSRREKARWGRHLQAVFPSATVIRSGSRIDSYSLLSEASVVAVWESTIGLEALARRKPVFVFSKTSYYWAGADVEYAPTSALLGKQIEQASKKVPDSNSAYPFLHWMMFGGSSVPEALRVKWAGKNWR